MWRSSSTLHACLWFSLDYFRCDALWDGDFSRTCTTQHSTCFLNLVFSQMSALYSEKMIFNPNWRESISRKSLESGRTKKRPIPTEKKPFDGRDWHVERNTHHLGSIRYCFWLRVSFWLILSIGSDLLSTDKTSSRGKTIFPSSSPSPLICTKAIFDQT